MKTPFFYRGVRIITIIIIILFSYNCLHFLPFPPPQWRPLKCLSILVSNVLLKEFQISNGNIITWGRPTGLKFRPSISNKQYLVKSSLQCYFITVCYYCLFSWKELSWDKDIQTLSAWWKEVNWMKLGTHENM